jgi:hypothetical protein
MLFASGSKSSRMRLDSESPADRRLPTDDDVLEGL